jgi:2,4-diaminopentanoate dehydrogenase
MARFLRAGTNVVTFAVVAMAYPPTGPTELREVIDAACVAGNSTFYASGTEPGAMSMNFPAAMLTMGGVVTGYRMEIYALDLARNYPLEEVLRDLMGFGHPQGFVPPRLSNGIVERWWTPDVRFISDLVGFELDDICLEWETHAIDHELDTAIGVIQPGEICAYRWELFGVIGERRVVTIEYIATISRDTPTPDHWHRLPDGVPGGLVFVVEGRPGFRSILTVDRMQGERLSGSIPMTALAATNAIPAAVAARPGHLGPVEIGHYATRRAR